MNISAQSLRDACQHGIEDPETNEYVFDCGTAARKAAESLGFQLAYDERYERREFRLLIKGNNLIAKLRYHDGDQAPNGWLRRTPRATHWSILLGKVTIVLSEEEQAELDELVRYRVANNKKVGWSIRQRDGNWSHGHDGDIIKCVLVDSGYSSPTAIKGCCVRHPHVQVMRPFQPEYPGGREWNINAPQHACEPQAGACPTWFRVLAHLGKGLDSALAESDWAKRNKVKSGGP